MGIGSDNKAPGARDDLRAALACALVCLSAAALCLWSGVQLKYADEVVYTQAAHRLANGLGYVTQALQPSAYRPPGYPFIISLVYRLHESVLLAKLLNVAALTATAWFASRIVKSLVPAGHLFAPLLILAYPLFTYTSSLLYPQIVGGFLFILVIYLLVRDPHSPLSGLACGVVSGVLILTIPAFVLVYASLFAFLFVGWLHSKICSFRFLSLFAAVTVLLVSLWIIRSSLIFDRFVFISTNSGINLLYGNSENTGHDTGVVDISRYTPPAGLNEAEQDSYYKQRAKEWVMAHPAEAALLYLKKSANYFNFKNKLSTKSEESRFKDLLMAVSYYPLLIAAVVRCFLWRRFRFSWPELLMYLLYFGNAFLSAVVYTRIRYRIPFDFLLVMMVAMFIGNLLEQKRRRTE